jgi:2'-5' RNA ligase
MQPSTALIVPVPEAEPVVGPWRATLDRAASWGVPAHITVLYPFLAPGDIDETVLSALRQIAAAVPRFGCALTHVGWFGERVVWLAPRPQEPLRDLTHAVWRRFPGAPPYGGAFDKVVPHLTVGHDAALPRLRRAADAVAARLPVHAAVSSLRLISGSDAPGSWHTVAELPLG